MKNTAILFGLLLFSITVLAQKGNRSDTDDDIAYALRLTDAEMERLPNIVLASFSVEDDNVIRATKGWEILVDEKAQAFVFRQQGEHYTVASADTPGFSEHKIAQWRDFCFCGPDQNGNCKHTYETRGDDTIIRCEGACKCNSFSIFEPDESPPEILGADMNWRPFPKW